MSLLFNMLSRLVITFLPRSKCLLISWLQSPSAVLLEHQKIKSDTVSPSISHEVMGPDAMIIVFWMLNFKPTFSHSSFTFIKRLFSSSSLSAIRVVSSAYLRLLTFLLAILIPACASSSSAFSQRVLHNPNPGEFAKIIKCQFWKTNLKIWDTLEEKISPQWYQCWGKSLFPFSNCYLYNTYIFFRKVLVREHHNAKHNIWNMADTQTLND